MSHIFETPDLRKENGLPPVLRDKVENEIKNGAKKVRTIWRSNACTESPRPSAFPALPRKVVVEYSSMLQRQGFQSY